MNKRNISIFLIIISIIGIFLICNLSKEIQEASYISLKKNNNDISEIIKIRKQVNVNLVNTICFDDNELFYDAKNNCYYYSLNKNNNNATSPKVSWDKNNINIAIEDINIDEELIKNSRKIKLLLFSNNEYFESNLICTTLPLINIDTSNITSNKYADMKITVFDNNDDNGYVIKDYSGKIHIRGGSSLNYPKNGFRIKLRLKEVEKQDREVSLFGFDKTDEYILYGAYNDQEKIRNVFSSRIWYEGCAKNNLLNINNGMYYKYVELFVNNEYWGLYAVGLPISEKNEEIDKTDIIENIYKKVSWRNENEIDFNDIGKVGGYEIKTNESNLSAWKYLRDYYNNLLNYENVEDLYKYVDIDNSIDIYLYFSMIMANDSVKGEDIKNFYLINKKIGDNTVMLYCPWDMDATWGNFWENEANNYTREYYYEPNTEFPYMKINAVQFLLDNNDPNIKKLINERYTYLRNHEWSNENLLSILDEYENDIFMTGAYLRDKDRWQQGNYIENEIGLSKFKEYVIDRVEFFDESIAKLVD